ncbi:MAG: ribosome maturation factor RimM [Clostridia bacterium]|nr:ribosome maturation factor RimM [Clostridia bacterium]
MNYLEIGQIVNTQGLKGEVRIYPFTNDSKRFNDFKKIYVDIDNNKIKLFIENIRYYKNLVIVKFKNIDDINLVEQYKGKYIFIDEEDKLNLPQNTYYISDLLNSKVIYNDEVFGILVDIYNVQSNDVYVIKKNDNKQIVIPANEDIIQSIDINKKEIIIDNIEGYYEN